MRRGELRLVEFAPARGIEADRRRPAVIVSNDRANAVAARLGRGVITVVAITSITDRVFGFQVLLPAAAAGLRVDSKAQAEQVRAVAVERLGPCVGATPGHARRCAAAPPAPVAQTGGTCSCFQAPCSCFHIGRRSLTWSMLIRSAIRGLLGACDAELEDQLRGLLCREDDYAAALLATVVGQDLDQGEHGVFQIVRRVTKDRVISTVDPDARHGRKTSAGGFNGYKGHVAVDPDSELITATTVTAGNIGDGRAAGR